MSAINNSSSSSSNNSGDGDDDGALREQDRKMKTTTLVKDEECQDDLNVKPCVCGRLSTEPPSLPCSAATKATAGVDHQVDDEAAADSTQVECDVCRTWHHADCVGLGPVALLSVEKYHCPRCEPLCGPSILKARTNSHRYDRSEPDASSKPTQSGTPDFVSALRLRKFPDAVETSTPACVVLDEGRSLTLPYLNQTGFVQPIVVASLSEGLEMVLPKPEFGLADVPEVAGGPDRTVDVIDSYSQEAKAMRLADFCAAFSKAEEGSESKDLRPPLNCLSLEVSDTVLGEALGPPAVARKLCWVNNVWPAPGSQAFEAAGNPPKVQKYCIMSMKDSYTDFHIDFGGTSVWYHMFTGEKAFYVIRPTPTNLALYERWHSLPNQSELFFADMVDMCYRLVLRPGQTLLIPSGWIHAVLTEKDSLVFGGNFLHSLNIQLQLKIYAVEERIRIPAKFRFPSFEAVNWLAAQKLMNDLKDLNSDSTPCPAHLLSGIKALLQTLKGWLLELDVRHCPAAASIPDPIRLVKDLGREVRAAERVAAKFDPPPRPERESTRKKQKKVLTDDFIDITQKRALAFFKTRPVGTKRQSSASSSSSSSKRSKTDPSAAQSATVLKASQSGSRAKLGQKRPRSDDDEEDGPEEDSASKKLKKSSSKEQGPPGSGANPARPLEAPATVSSRSKSVKRPAKESGRKQQQPKFPIKLRIPVAGSRPAIQVPKGQGGHAQVPPDYDLTDRDAVRQLLSNRSLLGARMARSPLKACGTTTKASTATMNDLNSELGDALAGFGDCPEVPDAAKLADRNGGGSGPIKLKLKMFGKSNKSSAGPPDRILMDDEQIMQAVVRRRREQNRKRKLNSDDDDDDVNGELCDISKVHQDDDYVYPTLELSDDELEVGPRLSSDGTGGLNGRRREDTAWSPKVRLRGLPVKQRGDRPTRNSSTKVAAVEKGLKVAAAKARAKEELQISQQQQLEQQQRQSLIPAMSAGAAAPTAAAGPYSPKDHQAGVSHPITTPLARKYGSALLNNPLTMISAAPPPAQMLTTGGSVRNAGNSCTTTSGSKPKKGSLTAKQRLGKILKLKF